MVESKYIKWGELWSEEVCLETAKDYLKNESYLRLLNNFLIDENITLNVDECVLNNKKLYFIFSETGGQNESDTQGWSRDYVFVVSYDYNILEIYYEKG